MRKIKEIIIHCSATKEGRNFSEHLNIFAIPTNELTSNKNLIQNPGY